ncbi:MAG: cytochrome b N-terminal domain-containing protein, partial [Armatimonadota bacterium]|nr:cytochrome b N-terminal domain-containing protein [Armatimonadota bacterium]
INRVYPQDFNPLYYTGGLSNLFLTVLVVSGILIWLYYEPSLEGAYASVQFLSDQVPYGVIFRGIHRYAADAYIVAVLLHLFRNWFTDRYREARDSQWLSGMVLLVFSGIAGVTGYLLVWDQRSQLLTSMTVQALQSVPLIGGWLAHAFLGGPGLSDATIVRFLFLHIAPAMTLYILLWWHYVRLRHPKVWPPALWVLFGIGLIFVLAAAIPAASGPPAQPGATPEGFEVDWFYLWPYVLARWIAPGWALALVAALVAYGMYIPYSLRETPQERGLRGLGQAVVVDENCTGCELCYFDCPYNAIYMVPSPYPGKSKAAANRKLLAVVVDPRCVECGICIGACPFEALELPRLLERDVQAQIRAGAGAAVTA